MSKKLARGPQSYLNEQLVSAMVPELLRAKGFETARTDRRGGMKFVDAKRADGTDVVFWLKQGWTDTRSFSAIQFGMFTHVTEPRKVPDSVFVNYVAARSARAKERGATHALMVHMVDSMITNYVALRIDDVLRAYQQQISHWPARARNTKTPTLYFEDSRELPDAASITAVTDLEVQLEDVAGVPPEASADSSRAGAKKVSAQVERRLLQQRFRILVGERFRWRCVISGTAIPEVLDAAHLPNRNWRFHNEATDGVLIRADLHRMLDHGLAEIRDGAFWLSMRARYGEYAHFHGKPVVPNFVD